MEIRKLNRALHTVLRSVFDVVQVREDFRKELENRDDAGCDAKRVHIAGSKT